jgi:hypothetical protein
LGEWGEEGRRGEKRGREADGGGGQEVWSSGGLEGWRLGGVESWRRGGQNVWMSGGLEVWRSGGLEIWRPVAWSVEAAVFERGCGARRRDECPWREWTGREGKG